MLHLLEIFVIVIAFAMLIAAGASTVRQAKALRRHTRQVSGEAQPKVFSIMSGANSAQGRAQALPDRLIFLQQKQAKALASLRRLMVIISAFQDARQPLNRVLSYIGR
ncbi:MAG: hypothetical protein ACYCXU_03995 [Thermoleophilia bacterium]